MAQFLPKKQDLIYTNLINFTTNPIFFIRNNYLSSILITSYVDPSTVFITSKYFPSLSSRYIFFFFLFLSPVFSQTSNSLILQLPFLIFLILYLIFHFLLTFYIHLFDFIDTLHSLLIFSRKY